jgi:hypothetical protein
MGEEIKGFDIATAAEDFAGEGRRVEVISESVSGAFRRRQMKLTVNGWTFSAIWGSGAYCTAARESGLVADPPPASPDAEIAVWPGDGSMIRLGDDTVAGWVSPANFLAAVEGAERDDESDIRAALLSGANDA